MRHQRFLCGDQHQLVRQVYVLDRTLGIVRPAGEVRAFGAEGREEAHGGEPTLPHDLEFWHAEDNLGVLRSQIASYIHDSVLNYAERYTAA